MRITNVNIPVDKIGNGLEPVSMHRLGQVVLLAGKNGSGKSRLLNLIANLTSIKPTIQTHNRYQQEFDRFKVEIKKLKEEIAAHEQIISLSQNEGVLATRKQQIDRCQTTILDREERIEICKSVLEWNIIETDALSARYTIVPFVPKSLEIKDCNKLNKEEKRQYAKLVNELGVDSLSNGTYARIQLIHERWRDATHSMPILGPNDIDKAIADYERLKELIKVFLNTDLSFNDDGDATIFGFPLGEANLSDGQKILIQYCLAIHCQQKSLDELILFLDEPENHLHPSVIIEIIERIKDRAGKGQIWVATHSIPLLSYFDPSYIWYVDNGKVSYAGTIPEKVLRSLLGDEDRVAKLQDFIGLPGMLALHRYSFQSLFHSPSVLTNKLDPQPLQVKEGIKKHLAQENKIRILDYGCGKGRLLANIIESNSESVTDFIKWFDYVGYDISSEDKEECSEVLKKIYPDWEARYFNEYSEIFKRYDQESFDVVIMCNVLHEIDPNKWLKIFSTNGELPMLLNDNGILLLVEDMLMPVGEKAYQKGFIVLNTAELKKLFKIKESDRDFGYSDFRGDGRLKSHVIKKKYLTRITSETRIEAIDLLNRTAMDKILDIRNKEVNYKNGKIHGFWIQQLANTTLALSELTINFKSKKSKEQHV